MADMPEGEHTAEDRPCEDEKPLTPDGVDVALKVDDLVTDGDRVIGRLSSSTGAGEILVLRIRDGQVTEQWTMADEPALRKQFGFQETPRQSGTSAN